MPTFAKRFLIAAAIIAAALALILLCVNLYLQSGGVQQRIHDTAAKALGTEVKIRSTTYTPWSGLVLRDISIPDATAPNINVVEAAALRIRFALSPLFEQRFVVTECALFEPKLIVRQLENGDWHIPLIPRRAAEVPSQPEVPTVPKVSGPSFKAELQRFRLGAGQIIFIDAKKRTVLLLEKADIDAYIAPDLTAKGTVAIGRMNVGGFLKPHKVGGPFTWDGKIFDLPEIQGSLAGGRLSGKFRLENGDAPTYALATRLDGVVLKKLADEAGMEPGQTEGQLNGSLDLTGDPRSTDSLAGKAHFELIAAKLKPIELLSKLGELLQINELQLLQLSDARADLTISNDRVHLDDVFLKSENLILTGQGPIRFDGKLKVEARLLINNKLQQQLQGILSDNFVESENPEYRQLPFTVSGKIDSPKTDLLDKLTGINLGQDVGGLLQNLFRAIPQQKKDDK